MVKLEGELTTEDRAVFGFDIKTDFDWKEYLVIYVQVFQLLANWHREPLSFENIMALLPIII